MTELTQLFLMTDDLAASRRFYETAIDLEPHTVGDTSVAYETGNCELKIQADFDAAQLAAFNLSSPTPGGRGEGAVFVLEVDQALESTYERMERVLEDDPGELLIDPRAVPWGGRIFLVRDPDGYVLELRSQ